MAEKKMMRVRLVKSMYGRRPGHAECVRGLGLRRIHQTVEVEDTPVTRGMLNKVSYMVKLEEV